MNCSIISLALLFCNISLFSQKVSEPNYFYIDSGMNIVKNDEHATLLLRTQKENDTVFTMTYYGLSTLKAIRTETYRNETTDTINGYVCYYNYFGQLDSMGYVKDNKRNGAWLYYEALSTKPDSCVYTKIYENGILQEILYTDNNKRDTFIPAKFEGSFLLFLERNLKYPRQAQDNKMQGIVKVCFTVNEYGHTSNYYLQKSMNLFLDEETLRIIKLAKNKWKPAYRNGIPVKEFHLQPINFVVADN